MLNLTRLHLGIAHESQFQGLGINAGIGPAANSNNNVRGDMPFDEPFEAAAKSMLLGLEGSLYAFEKHRN